MVDEPLSEKSNCPKCHTKTLERDPEGDIHCWGCGTTFPERVKSTMHENRLLEKHRFYEDNKPAILSDVQSIGAPATAKKWKINGVSLYHVLQRWDREQKEKEKEKPAEGSPDKPRPKYKRKATTRIGNFKRHRYYEEHRAEIIQDLLHLGRKQAIEKWGIPRSSLLYLESRWLTKQERAQIMEAIPKESVLENGHLPEFPAFSASWDPTVQVKWLETYGKLLDRSKIDANS
jgi:hypothetical protein